MAAASPSFDDRPPVQGIRRSVTLPMRGLSYHEQASLDTSNAKAEILYEHPNARIVSFSPPTDSIQTSSRAEVHSDADYPIDTIESLPWRSRGETLLAAGRMIVEKVRGSTNFLKCQTATHAILRNSQCWCVDGESKFVLRKAKLHYYRIELPSTSDDDKAKVEEFKNILPMVLKYEITPCPFIRAFQVDLPDDAITPRRRGTWKRRDSSQSRTLDAESPRLENSQNAKRWPARAPPTAYPTNGPSYIGRSSYSRSGSSAGLGGRRSSLFEELRSDSPDSNVNSEDIITYGTRSTSRNRPPVDGPESSVLDDELVYDEHRGRRTLSRQTSSSIPVSQRVASIERSGSHARRLPQLQIDQPIVNVEPQLSWATPTRTNNTGSLGSSHTEPVPDNHENIYLPMARSATTPITSIATRFSTDNGSSEIEGNSSPSTPSEDELYDRLLHEVISTPTYTPSDPDEHDYNREYDYDHEVNASRHEDAQSSQISSMMTEHAVSETPSHKGSERLASIFDKSDHASNVDEDLGYPPGETSSQFSASSSQGRLAVGADISATESFDLDKIKDCAQDQISSGAQPFVLPHIEPLQEDMETDNSARLSTNELVTAHKEPPEINVDTVYEEADDDISVVSSADSFHTLTSAFTRSQSIHEPDFDRTPTAQHFDHLSSPLPTRHKRDISEVTVTTSGSENANEEAARSGDQSALGGIPAREPGTESGRAKLGADAVSFVDESLDTGLRQRLRDRRSFSPMPPPSTIINTAHSRESPVRHVAKTLLQQAVVKPIEAAFLIFHILARIAGGATVSDLMSGELFRRPEHRRRVSGFADQSNQVNGDEDQEDDYGMPIRGRGPGLRKQSLTWNGLRPGSSGIVDEDAQSFVSID